MSIISRWSELPAELLDLVMGALRNPADRLRSLAVCRSVCRSWHMALRLRHHHHQLPWIMLLQDGHLLSPSDSDGCSHRLPSFPHNGILLGSTHHWLALGLGHKYVSAHAHHYLLCRFLLYNPFSNTSVPLTDLDAIIAATPFRIRKFLMRSTAHDFVAVLTNNTGYPIIIILPGKGTWLPHPHQALPYIDIIDLAFLGDKLYGITKDEDLISLDLTVDAHGKPMAINYERVIKQPIDDYDDDDDEEEDGDNDYDAWTDDDDGDEVEDEEEDSRLHISGGFDYTCDRETNEMIVITRNLVESCGKLLMVRRRRQIRKDCFAFTRQVDVLEADTDAGVWIPLSRAGSGLGGGRSLFIGSSIGFSKSVDAPRGDVEEDVIYFIDTGEVFHLKTQTTSLPRWLCRPPQGMTWLFPPELVL